MRAGDSRGEGLRDDRVLVVSLMELDIGDTVFVSVDIQPRARMPWTEQNLLDDYREEQFTLVELNQAVDHFFDVMLPAAEAVSKLARQRGIPRVFVHWSRKAIDRPATTPRILSLRHSRGMAVCRMSPIDMSDVKKLALLITGPFAGRISPFLHCASRQWRDIKLFQIRLADRVARV
jgi:hypothetical protein